jgi:hypothetical protein
MVKSSASDQVGAVFEKVHDRKALQTSSSSAFRSLQLMVVMGSASAIESVCRREKVTLQLIGEGKKVSKGGSEEVKDERTVSQL